MVIVDSTERCNTIETRGKLGLPNGLGHAVFGVSLIGEDFAEAGIYMRRPRPKGQILVRARHYHPINPKTAQQVVCQNKFAGAVAAWQALTDTEKDVWRRMKRPHRMSGYNRFLKNFMAQ